MLNKNVLSILLMVCITSLSIFVYNKAEANQLFAFYKNYIPKFALPVCGAITSESVALQLKKDIYKDFNELRVPNTLILNDGTIVVASHSPYIIAKSKDYGETWRLFSPTMHGQCLCYDKMNDAIFIFDSNLIVYRSTDGGETFDYYARTNNKYNVLQNEYEKCVAEEEAYAKSELSHGKSPQRYYFECTNLVGPGLGIQLRNGVLVAPVYSYILKMKAQKADSEWFGEVDSQGYMLKNGHPYRRDDLYNPANVVDFGPSRNFVIYSKDFGKNWIQSPSTPEGIFLNEASIAEGMDNQVIINSRGGTEYWHKKESKGRRVLIQRNDQNCVSREDYQITGFDIEPVSDGLLYDPLVHAAFSKVSYNGRVFWLFCNCYIPGEFTPRRNLMLQVSPDAKHWKEVMLLTPYNEETDGYCSIYSNNNRIGFAYEKTRKDRGINYIEFNKQMIKLILSVLDSMK